MGMYTQLHLGVELTPATPNEVISILRYMIDGTHPNKKPPNPDQIPEHPLFGDTRWRWFLTSGSYIFRYEPHACLRQDIDGYTTLSITCNFKNYDKEVELFLDWLNPYIYAKVGEWLGYQMYENDNEPKMIYKEK